MIPYKKSPLISIIIPVYDVEKYLRKCLDSLVYQTLHEIEIIIVNDGSPDNSQSIIDQYVEQYPEKIRAYQKINGGPGDARNYGVEKAEADYLMFVDSDDYVEPQMCEDMYALIKKYDADMGVFDMVSEDEEGNVLRKRHFVHHASECIDLKENFSVFNEVSGYVWNKIFRRELFKNFRFPVGVYHEDTITLVALLHARRVVKTNKAYYHYLKREGSITTVPYSRKHLEDFYTCQEILEEAFYKSQYKVYTDQIEHYLIIYGAIPRISFRIMDMDFLRSCFQKAKEFRRKRNLSATRLFFHRRSDGKNYFLKLPLKHQVYYSLGFLSADLLKFSLMVRILIKRIL